MAGASEGGHGSHEDAAAPLSSPPTDGSGWATEGPPGTDQSIRNRGLFRLTLTLLMEMSPVTMMALFVPGILCLSLKALI